MNKVLFFFLVTTGLSSPLLAADDTPFGKEDLPPSRISSQSSSLRTNEPTAIPADVFPLEALPQDIFNKFIIQRIGMISAFVSQPSSKLLREKMDIAIFQEIDKHDPTRSTIFDDMSLVQVKKFKQNSESSNIFKRYFEEYSFAIANRKLSLGKLLFHYQNRVAAPESIQRVLLFNLLQNDDFSQDISNFFRASAWAQNTQYQQMILQHLLASIDLFHTGTYNSAEANKLIHSILANLRKNIVLEGEEASDNDVVNACYMSVEKALASQNVLNFDRKTFILMTDTQFNNADPKFLGNLNELFTKHPNTTLLLNLGEHFVSNGVASLKTAQLPQSLLHLALLNTQRNVTQIGGNFLADSKKLKSIDPSALTCITSIGENFLRNANALENIDTAGFVGLTVIDHHCLAGAHTLQVFDTSSLINLKSVKECFLSGAHKLTVFDKSNLIKLEGGLGAWSLSAAQQLQAQDPTIQRGMFAGIFGGFIQQMSFVQEVSKEQEEMQSIKLMLQETQQRLQSFEQVLQLEKSDQLQMKNELERLQRKLDATQQQRPSVKSGTVASDVASTSTKTEEKDKEQK